MERDGEAKGTFSETLTEVSTFVWETEYSDIPDAVLQREKEHVLDTLGCILYGSTTPWVRKVVRTIDHLDETGSSSVLGTEMATSPERASLVNGMASHSMDFDDHCQDAGVHAGSATIPTALAVAEAAEEPVSGQDFLTAVTIGTEVGIRSGFGIGYGSVGRGWHIAGWTGAFAGAATTAKLLGLDHDRIGHALAIAGTQGCGLLGAQYGAEVKRFHMGKAAESGYLGAALANESFTGDPKIFSSRYGAIGPTMSDDFDLDAVVDSLGKVYRISDKLSLKPFPSVGQVHAPVDAVIQIVQQEDIELADISSVTVRSTPTVKDHVGWEYEPIDIMSAQSNIQYALATFLVNGDITIDAYTPSAIDRKETLEAIDRISIVVDESLDEATFGSVVEVTVDDKTYENAVHAPRGYPSNPMSAEEQSEKFRNQASKCVPETSVDAIIEFVDTIETRDAVTDLIEYCR